MNPDELIAKLTLVACAQTAALERATISLFVRRTSNAYLRLARDKARTPEELRLLRGVAESLWQLADDIEAGKHLQ